MIMNKKGPPEILLVEDNPGDVLLTLEAFKVSNSDCSINVAKDGEMALKMLYGESPYADIPRPSMILLDLNLPKMNGREVLECIKCDDNLKRIPVVVFTSSKADTDIVGAYNLHANSYIVKPIESEEYSEIVESIENFWFSVVALS